MAPYPPWSPIALPNSCLDCWMLFAGYGYCRYERERTKVECDCAQPRGKGAAAAVSSRRGEQLVDGRWVTCKDCDGKMYFWVNRVIYQCPGDVVNGKVRKHREVHGRFWAGERGLTTSSES